MLSLKLYKALVNIPHVVQKDDYVFLLDYRVSIEPDIDILNCHRGRLLTKTRIEKFYFYSRRKTLFKEVK
jgi:hypothetical protein